jgi:glycerol uptake facilitator-like aquaporin
MAERLFPASTGSALLANAIATGAALAALIVTFGPVSGSHFNPLVTIAHATTRRVPWSHVPAYIAAQVIGACAGVLVAHAMFAEPLLMASTHARSGGPQLFSEFVATFGLLAVVWSATHRPHALGPVAVAGYITAAYWFTASTSFANPAATLARALTDTFAGIRPRDVPGFVAAECLGAAAAVRLFRWLMPVQPGDLATSGAREPGAKPGAPA